MSKTPQTLEEFVSDLMTREAFWELTTPDSPLSFEGMPAETLANEDALLEESIKDVTQPVGTAVKPVLTWAVALLGPDGDLMETLEVVTKDGGYHVGFAPST